MFLPPQLLGEYDSLRKEHEGVKVTDLLVKSVSVLFHLDKNW